MRAAVIGTNGFLGRWLVAVAGPHPPQGRGLTGEAHNIASAKPTRVGDVSNEMLRLRGVRPSMVLDPDRMRNSEAGLLVDPYVELERLTGWKPEIPLTTTLADILENAEPRAG